MASESYVDGPGTRAKLVLAAFRSLVAASDAMRQGYGLLRSTDEIVADVTATMRVAVSPHGLSVLQALSEQFRATAFNHEAEAMFSDIRQEFGNAIQDFATVRDGRTPARRTRGIAANAWKQDAGADRRIREMVGRPPTKWRSPYRSRPNLYDPGVVRAFAETITRAAERKKFARGNSDRGLMVAVLVAAINWATMSAWQGSGLPGSKPPRPATRLGVLKIARGR